MRNREGGMSQMFMTATFILVMILLVSITVLAQRNNRAYTETQHWVQHTHITLAELSTLKETLVDVETGARGYIITGDERFLDAFRDSGTTLKEAIARFRLAIDDNPKQISAVDALIPVIDRKMHAMTDAIELRRAKGIEAVAEVSHMTAGRTAMEEIRARIEGLRSTEVELLDQRRQASESEARHTVTLIWTACALALTFMALSGLMLLRQSRLRARAEDERDQFFTSALDLLCIAGLDGYFKRLNPAFMRVLGFTERELLAQPFSSFVHPDDLAGTLAEVEKLGQGIDSTSFENRYRCKDGSWRWLLWTSTAVKDRGLIFATARDITERRNLEDALKFKQSQLEVALTAEQISLQDARKNAEALERSNRELREFAHVASHDLQEPLRMVSSFCSMLSDNYRGRLDAEADEFITHAVDGAKRMQVLIQDLLSYSRLEGQGMTFQTVDVEQAVRTAKDNLAALISESATELTWSELPTLAADRRQIVQLVQNLIGNAIKYRSQRPSRVRISSVRDGAAWRFSVSDDGIGIASRHHERIFGMFKRLHGRERYAGTGIGLAICKKVVEMHGGRIWVESELDKGATFHFTIPDHLESGVQPSMPRNP